MLYSKKWTLVGRAKSDGNDGVVNSSSDLNLPSNSMPAAGLDPAAAGRVFSLENGKRSAPFAGENGVVVLELQNKTIAPEVGDYAMSKNELLKNLNNRSGLTIAQAIKDSSNIKHKRYKFY